MGKRVVRYLNSGLEATPLHALRLVRPFTARRKIVKFQGCYRGAHDKFLVSVGPPKGMMGKIGSPLKVMEGAGVP